MVKCSFVGAGLKMAPMSDGSGGGAMERVGVDCRKVSVAIRMSWKAATVSEMEPYCMWAHCWEDMIAWGVSVMLVMDG